MPPEIEARIEAFRSDLANLTPEEMFVRHVRDQQCYAITNEEHAQVRNLIAQKFNTSLENIVVVGSAKLGFTLPPKSRAWRKADFLILAVELDRILQKGTEASPGQIGSALQEFYRLIDDRAATDRPSDIDQVEKYFQTTVQATNDRRNRIARGREFRSFLEHRNALGPRNSSV
jgi:hypothetical protein